MFDAATLRKELTKSTERVAKAIFSVENGSLDGWDKVTKDDPVHKKARAAIWAIATINV